MRDDGIRGYLRGRLPVLAVLGAWSVLEAGQTFLVGFALAKSLDWGFLRGRQGVGLLWLALAAGSVPIGAYGTARVFRALAALVEPLRDLLVETVVRRGVRTAVRGGWGARDPDTRVVSRLTHQVEIARDAFGGLVLVLRSFVFTAIGALAGMCALAPVTLLIVLPPLAAGIALFVAALRPLARRQHRYLAADEALADELGTLAAGLRDITACGAEDSMAELADARTEAVLRAERTLARWGVARAAALAVGGQLPVVLLLVGAPWLLSTHRITAGALLGALTYLTQSLQPALQNLVHTLSAAGTRLGVVISRITGPPGTAAPDGGPTAVKGTSGPTGTERALGAAAAARATEPGAEGGPGEPEFDARGTASGPRTGGGPAEPALRFDRVSFGYGPGAQPVVRDLDLTVGPREHLVVVGPSGIGKSTVVGLAAGLLRPDRGRVVVAGRPALVPQEAYVFSGTVADNLRYLRPAAADRTVLAAAAEVGAGDLVAALGGLGAPVEPGELSAGERQLLALARTYLSPAPLVLLDEATCHLDPAAEAVAESAFARRPGGTLVVVAHRISSARRADRILVLDGTHAVSGTHEDLPARSPLYRDLVGSWSAVGTPAVTGGRDLTPSPPPARS